MVTQSISDVFQNGQMRKECIVLVHDPDAPLLWGKIRDVSSLYPDAAAG